MTSAKQQALNPTMTNVKELKQARAKKLRETGSIQSQLNAALARKRLLCHHCGKRSTVGKTTYVQTRFYIAPYSCTGGDYWQAGEGRFVCLHCGYENRLWPEARQWIAELKDLFAKVEDVYEDRHGRTDGKGHVLPKRQWCN